MGESKVSPFEDYTILEGFYWCLFQTHSLCAFHVWSVLLLGGGTKLEDLQQRYAELSPSYGHLGVPGVDGLRLWPPTRMVKNGCFLVVCGWFTACGGWSMSYHFLGLNHLEPHFFWWLHIFKQAMMRESDQVVNFGSVS